MKSTNYGKRQPLMPVATAVWLVANTSLTFEQIADFTGLHTLEISAIADGQMAVGMNGNDPIIAGQLTQEEIKRCQDDPSAKLCEVKPTIDVERRAKGAKYTPLSRRQDKPYAIAWLLKYRPELSDSQIVRLVGTTKQTIECVRDRTHWIFENIKYLDPVIIGLCTQVELDIEVSKTNKTQNSTQIEVGSFPE